MSKQKIVFITFDGAKKIKQKIREYQKKLKNLSASKAEIAVSGGDLWHDNPAFEEVERLQKLYQQLIAEMRFQLVHSRVVSNKKSESELKCVRIGSKLKIRHVDGSLKTIFIVGSGEGDPGNAKVAYDSPLGSFLIGKKLGFRGHFEINGQKDIITVMEITIVD